jgi:hypothetical protein
MPRLSVIGFTLLLVGCSRPLAMLSMASTTPFIGSDLQLHLGRFGSATFRSWNGEWKGTDIDSDYTLLPDGRFVLVHYGRVVTTRGGFYAIDDSGRLTLTFVRDPLTPSMFWLRSDDRGVIAMRDDPERLEHMLRLLPGDDKSDARAAVERWSGIHE